MQSDLSTRPYVEILVLAEQAIKGGASPAYTMKYLCDRGAPPASAEQAVLEATKSVQVKRQQEQDLKKAENKENYTWGFVLFAIAGLFLVVGFLMQLEAARYVAYGFVIMGISKVRATWLKSNNYV